MQLKFPSFRKGASKPPPLPVRQPPPIPSPSTASYQQPTKVFIEREDGEFVREWSEDEPERIRDKFYDLLHGYHGYSNLIQLFYCLPEVFAPIHEIASRVADCVWELRKDWNDEVDYKNETFNRLFMQPNPLVTHKQLIYQAVCYEILTGRQFFQMNRPDTLNVPGQLPKFENVLTLNNLPAHQVKIEHKTVDPYTATTLDEFVKEYTVPGINGSTRRFTPDQVLPVVHFSLEKPHDMNCSKALILGAEKAIENLLEVYLARKAIYIKRGMLGLVVSKKADDSGPKSLTRRERREIERELTKDYGIHGGQQTIGIASAPVDFVNTNMTIKEMMPFDETLADAVAIYKVLRVPRHLVPSKDQSTFSNAEGDMTSFYIDVIVPWAQGYAQLFTNGFNLAQERRYIFANYDHIGFLQEDEGEKANTSKTNTDVAVLQYEKGIIKKNERNAMLGYASVPDGDKYVTDDTNPDPLAIKLGVGGVQALQSILASTTMAEEAKAHALVVLFGLSQPDADKLVTTNKPENDGKNIAPEGSPIEEGSEAN